MENNKQIEVKLKRGVKYFTISQIIKEASRIFCFDEPTNKASSLYIALKREIGRKLKGVKSYGETPRNRKYSRNDVQHLLQVDLYNYFIKKSSKLNENKRKFLEKIERPTDEPQKNLKLISDSEQSRKTAEQRYNELIKQWMEEEMDEHIRERAEGRTELDIKIETEKKRREIFFELLYQTLFDFMIEFDEARFHEDLKHKLFGYDFPDDAIKVEATLRLRDNRNYYELKKSPEEIRNLLVRFFNISADEHPK